MSVGPDGILICEGPLDVVRASGVDFKTAAPISMSALTSGDQSRENDEYLPEDIRMDRQTGRLIRLIKAHYTEKELFTTPGLHDMPWTVEDVLSGSIYTRYDNRISQEVYNAMETLGWAALDDHPDTEIEGD